MINIENIILRPTEIDDLETLFKFQLDEKGGYLAAFMPNNYDDKDAYFSKYVKLLNNETVNNQTILINNIIVGSIAKFEIDGESEITYWIDRQYWGIGIASNALIKFLKQETTRPLFGRVAFDNIGSQKVLAKCGFIRVGVDKGFASARKMEIEEYIYCLSKK